MLLTNANTAFGELGAICESIEKSLTKMLKSGIPIWIEENDKAEMRVLGNCIHEILALTIHGYETKDNWSIWKRKNESAECGSYESVVSSFFLFSIFLAFQRK